MFSHQDVSWGTDFEHKNESLFLVYSSYDILALTLIMTFWLTMNSEQFHAILYRRLPFINFNESRQNHAYWNFITTKKNRGFFPGMELIRIIIQKTWSPFETWGSSRLSHIFGHWHLSVKNWGNSFSNHLTTITQKEEMRKAHS